MYHVFDDLDMDSDTTGTRPEYTVWGGYSSKSCWAQ